MKFNSLHRKLLILGLIGGMTATPLLTSCGGSGGGDIAGIGGTGITQGEITAFGSIFVNGVEFNTDNSEFEVDGVSGLTQSALSIGMIVTITGDVDDNGLTGVADSVKYDDEIQGPVSAATPPADGQRTLTIFGQSVLIDEFSTSFDDTTFDAIAVNDILEISGFKTSPTQVKATFVERKGAFPATTEIELKGVITDFVTSSFKLSGITINIGPNTEIDVPTGVLENGLFVEVKGDLQSNLTTILAREVELEDDDFEDGSEISLQGVISEFNSVASFKVGSQLVDASGITMLTINLENGLNVEVEGQIVNGVLIANALELRDGSVEIKASVQSIIGNQIQFQFPPTSGSILVTTNNQTRFEDETTTQPNISLIDIQSGDFVKVEGFEIDGDIFASQVKRLNPTGEDTEVQGDVTAYTQNSSITILGLNFALDGSEDYEPLNLASTIAIGDVIELVDRDPADGIIDKVESE